MVIYKVEIQLLLLQGKCITKQIRNTDFNSLLHSISQFSEIKPTPRRNWLEYNILESVSYTVV